MTGICVGARLQLWYNEGQYVCPRGLATREHDGLGSSNLSPRLRGRFGVRR
jgi:hypothetical protein